MANAAQISKTPLSLAISGGVCDLSKRTYFHQTVSANTAFTFINEPVDCTLFEVEINHTSGVLFWPANVRWVGGTAPQNLSTGKVHLFQFRRLQSTGTDQWMGSYLPNI